MNGNAGFDFLQDRQIKAPKGRYMKSAKADFIKHARRSGFMKSIATSNVASHTKSQANSLPQSSSLPHDGGGKVGVLRVLSFFITLSWLFVSAGPALGETVSEVTYKGERLTVRAVDAPVVPLLRSIAEAADIEILVSKSVESARITASIRQEPLEPAMKRLLERFNHMMMYGDKSGKVVLSSIKVLSQGESGAPVTSVKSKPAQPAAATTSGFPAMTDREPAAVPAPPSPGAAAAGAQGVIVPRTYASADKQGMSAVMAKDFENQEQIAFNEIAALKAEIREAKDPQEQAALNIVLMEKLREFEDLQRANRNRMEALHRMELFNQTKQQKD